MAQHHSQVPLHPVIAHLPTTVPFVGPETLERMSGVRIRARMGANESPFGPAPSVIEAVGQAALEMNRYGDAEALSLRTALGLSLDLPPAALTVGEGIDGVFSTLCRLYLGPGESVVASLGAYPTFLYHAAAQGARIETVPYLRDANDLDALARKTRDTGARMVFLANPDNPTGSHHPAAAIEDFIDSIPSRTLVVLDEAYAEFAPAGTLPALSTERANLIRTRTFSKAHGLAGMRVGYAFGHADVIGRFDAIRNHFGVTRLSQIAALEALRASDWTAQVVDETRQGLDAIAANARANGMTALPTATNFVALDCGRDGAYAQAVLDGLAAEGVFIRKPKTPGLDRLIRVSIAAPEEIVIFGEALASVRAALG